MPNLARMDGLFDPRGYATDADAPPFGEWYLEQAARGGLIGQIAVVASSDRSPTKIRDADAPDKLHGRIG